MLSVPPSGKRNHQPIGRLALLFCLIIALSGCTEEEPIRIGFIGGLSGRVADLGTSGRNGALLAVEELNRQGGIEGRTIKLITADDQQSPDGARKAIRSLISERVAAIVGPMTSSMAVEIVPEINRAKIVTISPTANTQELAGIDDYFFRVISSTGFYAQHLAEFLFKEKKLRRISIIYDLKNAAFTESFQAAFRKKFIALGGTVVRTQTFHTGPDVSFYEITREAIAQETEGVMLLANALDAALICQQVRKLSPDLTVAGTGWSATEKLIEIGGAAVEGILLQQFFDRNNKTARYLAFREAFYKRFSAHPGFASVAGYDATNLVIESLKTSSTGRSLKQTIIEQGNFAGVQQPIKIDRFGDASRTPYISTVRNGNFVVLQ